jgi:NitT/TauT family transport system substrate-binding protein
MSWLRVYKGGKHRGIAALLLLLAMATAMAALSACSRTQPSAGSQQQPPAPARAKVAVLPFISSAPVFLAKERGYFAAEGIEVEIVLFNAAQAVAVAVASNDADFGVTAFTGAFFNLAGKGALKVIAAQSREEPGYEFVAYLASDAAYKAGLHAPRDLVGKTVAISTLGSSFHYALGQLAQKQGFSLDQLQLRPMQSIPNMVAALAGGQVDATLLPANNAHKLVQDVNAHVIGWVSEQTPWQLGSLFTSSRNVAEQRAWVARFVHAYQRGLADYAAAFLQKDAEGKRVFGAEANAALPTLQKWVDPKPSAEAVQQAANYMDPQGRLRVADIYRQVDWYRSQGLLEGQVDAASFIDLGFVQGHLDVPGK